MKFKPTLKIVIFSAFIAFNLVDIREAKSQLKQVNLEGCNNIYNYPVAGNVMGKEFGSPINVREEPNVSSKVIYSASSGDAISITEVFENNNDGYCWYKVSFQSQNNGWVRGDLISIFMDDHH
ncbi:SH3 domain-containing protein [Myxosarcina sp. GI1]|uniref:SH3 domain-containing protein n=1 Tax=Myxosarcina sp. GI1 TaxID=1541065 RepID=UPI0012DFF0A1|nr:SH3 domain-containing protein [Myxosarcina sp. GI1]